MHGIRFSSLFLSFSSITFFFIKYQVTSKNLFSRYDIIEFHQALNTLEFNKNLQSVINVNRPLIFYFLFWHIYIISRFFWKTFFRPSPLKFNVYSYSIFSFMDWYNQRSFLKEIVSQSLTKIRVTLYIIFYLVPCTLTYALMR